MDKQAEKIIRLQETEESNNANFRATWQDTAALIFPRESNITVKQVKGQPKTTNIYDTTAIEDSKIMADGLLSALIPAGEYFFRFNVSKDNPGGTSEEYKTYLDRAVDKQHRAMFASNFMLQIGETMRSLVVFGPGNLYSEWTKDAGGLNYRDYDVGLYQVLENSSGKIDTMILKFPLTASQAYEKWEGKVGKYVIEALNDDKRINEIFWFIQYVAPREDRNIFLSDFTNMPFKSVYVGVKDRNTIEEGGFEEFPFSVPRWSVTSGEVMGRGVGTDILPQVRVLNTMVCDFIELGNKHVNPPLEVLESFDGEVDVTPGAINSVVEKESIRAIQREALGNFPVNEKIIEMQRQVIHNAFYRDVFIQLADLKGDRRTTVEIRQRILEGLRRLGQPVMRIWSELMESVIIRSFRLLIRNGEIPPPPPGLQLLEIEYLGLMANALSSGQARGFQQAAAIADGMAENFPEAKDNLNVDEGFRDLARSLGCKAEHLNTPEQRDAIRQMRMQQLQQQQALEAAQAVGKGYKDTSKAPEEGSLAGELQNA